jgi:hypothetical protein
LWLDKARKLGEEDPFGSISSWPDAPGYEELTEQDYLTASKMKLANSTEKIRYIRIRAWWAANDVLRRGGNEGTAGLSEEARGNLQSLLTDLSEDDEQQRLMKSEVARELGCFEEAERLLAMKYSKSLQPAVRRISELVKDRNGRVTTL